MSSASEILATSQAGSSGKLSPAHRSEIARLAAQGLINSDIAKCITDGVVRLDGSRLPAVGFTQGGVRAERGTKRGKKAEAEWRQRLFGELGANTPLLAPAERLHAINRALLKLDAAMEETDDPAVLSRLSRDVKALTDSATAIAKEVQGSAVGPVKGGKEQPVTSSKSEPAPDVDTRALAARILDAADAGLVSPEQAKTGEGKAKTSNASPPRNSVSLAE